MSKWCWLARGLIVTLTVFLPFVIRVELAAADAGAEAKRLLEEGERAYANGEFAAALDKFEVAYQLKHSPRLLFLIGQAADSDGQAERALESYRSYLLAAPDAPNRAFVTARIAKLQGAETSDSVGRTRAGASAARPTLSEGDGPRAYAGEGERWRAQDEAWFQGNRRLRNAGKVITAAGGFLALIGLVQSRGASNSAFGVGVAGTAIYGLGSLIWAGSTMYGTKELIRRGVRVSKVGAVMSVVGVFAPPMLWIAGPMQNATLRRAHDGVASPGPSALDWVPGLRWHANF